VIAVPLVASLVITIHAKLNQPLELYVGAAGGVFLAWAVVRRPSVAGPIVFVLLPVQTVVFAWIYAQGFDAGSFRPLAALKELVVLGLVLRAERDRRRLERPLDGLDRMALAYVALAVVYLFLGRFLAELPGSTASARLTGFREDAMFVVVLYAARNISWTTKEVGRLLRWLLVGCCVAGYFVLWHQLRDQGFATWLVNDDQIIAYLADVIRLDTPGIQRTLHHFAEADVRLMGSFLSPIQLADYLVIPFGLLLALGLRGRMSLITLGLTGLTGYLVLETRTRVAIFALSAMVALLLLLRRAAATDRRVTGAVAASVAAIILVPFILAPIVLGKADAEASNQGHISEWSYSLSEFAKHPQGSGLGSNSSASVRFGGVDRSNGNAFLLIGNELGVLGLVLFLGTLVLTARALARRLRVDPDPPFWVISAALIGVGLAVQGLTHHSLESLPVAWTAFLLLGLSTAHEPIGALPEPGAISRRSGTRLPASA
jgi:hypothetical protein